MFRTPPRMLVGLGWVLALGGCLEAPINTNELRVPAPVNSIEGTVVFGGTDADPIGPTFITVFSARNPGPPAGTGSPVAIAPVPQDAYSDDRAGLRAASFGVSGLPDGEYFVNGLMDVDGDFSPFDGVLSGATCGDWIGSHLASVADLANPDIAVVPLSGGRVRTGVSVLVGAQLPVERPVFEILGDPKQGGNPILSLAAVEAQGGGVFRVRTTALDTTLGEVPIDLGPACSPLGGVCDPLTQPWCLCDPAQVSPESDTFVPCSTGIMLELVDADGDKQVDLLDPLTGEPNIFPRVLMNFVPGEDEEVATYEFNGRQLTEQWVTRAIPLGAELLAVQGGLLPPEILPPAGQELLVSELSITVVPIFRHYHEDGAQGLDGSDPNGPYDDIVLNPKVGGSADAVPKGAWAVTLISSTGQTWTVPNIIGELSLPGPAPHDPLTQAGAVIIAK